MILTLLSDFGTSDVYIAVMKGTIAQINSSLTVIDLTHHVPPQDIATARFHLMSAYPYFPVGTVHVAVVDPGVGGQRRAIAIQLESGFLVAPDNGLVSGVLSQQGAIAAVELTNPSYWRTSSPSTTFHGRDIFAAAGAHLTSGVPLQELGTGIDLSTIVQLPIPDLIRTGSTVQGVIQAIDHFGNLITTIPGSDVAGKSWSVRIENSIYSGQATYSESEPGEILALVGSHGWVEVAANRANAQTHLNLKWGSVVSVMINEDQRLPIELTNGSNTGNKSDRLTTKVGNDR